METVMTCWHINSCYSSFISHWHPGVKIQIFPTGFHIFLVISVGRIGCYFSNLANWLDELDNVLTEPWCQHTNSPSGYLNISLIELDGRIWLCFIPLQTNFPLWAPYISHSTRWHIFEDTRSSNPHFNVQFLVAGLHTLFTVLVGRIW